MKLNGLQSTIYAGILISLIIEEWKVFLIYNQYCVSCGNIIIDIIVHSRNDFVHWVWRLEYLNLNASSSKCWQQWYHSNSPCASALIHRFQYQSFRELHMDPTCAFVWNLNQPYLLFTIRNIRSSKTPKVQAGQTGEFTLKITLYNHSANSTDNNVLFLSRFCFFFWTGLSINSTPSDLQVTLPQESKEFLFHWSTSNCSAALLILAFDLTLKLLFTSWQKLQLLHVILYLKTGKR